MTDLAIMWIGSLITIWLYGQIAALSGWILLHYPSVASKRERRDTLIAFAVGLAFILLQLIWSFRGLVQCQGAWMEIATDILAFGSGWYIKSSLERRYSFYLFACQEDRKRANLSPTT